MYVLGRFATALLPRVVAVCSLLALFGGAFPQVAGAAVADIDGDGVPDSIDLDDDGDGMVDIAETGEDYHWAVFEEPGEFSIDGTIGTNTFTYTSSKNVDLGPSLYSASLFPARFAIPSNDPGVRNHLASSNTIVFDEPIRNPTVAFASVGNGTTTVGARFAQAIDVQWHYTGQPSWVTTIDADHRGFSANEGYIIATIPGVHTRIDFDYLANESWLDMLFGADTRAEIDSDSDNRDDHLDVDSDADGIPDSVEVFGANTPITPLGVDTDGNGLDDAFESSPGAGEGLTAADSDNDGIPDYLDLDSDNDGNPDANDPNPTTATAVDDSVHGDAGDMVSVAVAANDDFVWGEGLTLTHTGGTAVASAVSVNATTGEISYDIPVSHSGSATIDYEICHTDPEPDVCAEATVTVSSTGVPGAPTITDITPGNHRYEVAFIAPDDDGGAPITHYEARKDDGDWQLVDHLDSKFFVYGASNKTQTTIQIRAVNRIGPGDSDNENVAPVVVPVAPDGQTVDTFTVETGTITQEVNGTAATIPLTVAGDDVVVQAETAATLTVKVENTKNQPYPPTPEGVLRLQDSDRFQVSATGLRPGSVMNVWLFSEPQLLGEVLVQENGTANVELPIPANVALGDHILQLNVIDADNATVSTSMRVQVFEHDAVAQAEGSDTTGTNKPSGNSAMSAADTTTDTNTEVLAYTGSGSTSALVGALLLLIGLWLQAWQSQLPQPTQNRHR